MPINVNRAGEEDLALLPGIGPNLAKRILEVRKAVGRFSSPDELLQVPGIGKRILQKMQGRICF
jgi:competence protein ComEA